MGRPKRGRFADCLAAHLHVAPDESAVYAAWADAVRVARIVSRVGDGGVVARHLQVRRSYWLLAVAARFDLGTRCFACLLNPYLVTIKLILPIKPD